MEAPPQKHWFGVIATKRRQGGGASQQECAAQIRSTQGIAFGPFLEVITFRYFCASVRAWAGVDGNRNRRMKFLRQ